MSYHQISLEQARIADFVPQAIIGRSGAEVAQHLGISLINSHDDFDSFEGAVLVIEGGPIFALKHYRGYPEDTITIYLPNEISKLDDITDTVRFISEVMQIPAGWIAWQRKDHPDL